MSLPIDSPVNLQRDQAAVNTPGRSSRLVSILDTVSASRDVSTGVDQAQYSKTAPKKKGERRHEDMLDPVAALRLATLRALWTDSSDA